MAKKVIDVEKIKKIKDKYKNGVPAGEIESMCTEELLGAVFGKRDRKREKRGFVK